MDFAERAWRQWTERYPDLDTSHILVVGRILRIAAAVTATSEVELGAHGLTRGEFDVLCTLRRADGPLRAGEITTVTGASAAAITKRLDRLTQAGLALRAPSERGAVCVAGHAKADTSTPTTTVSRTASWATRAHGVSAGSPEARPGSAATRASWAAW